MIGLEIIVIVVGCVEIVVGLVNIYVHAKRK